MCFPAVLVFCKMDMFLSSSLSNMLCLWSVGGMVSGRWSVDFIKPWKNHVWSSDFACAL